MAIKPAKKVLAIGEPDSLGFFMGIGAIFYGIFLMLPIQSFAQSPAFEVVRQIMPEFYWGLILLILAVTKLTIWRNYMISGIPRISQIIVNFIMAVFWIFLVVSVFVSEPRSTLMVIYTMFIIAHLWIASRRRAALRRER